MSNYRLHYLACPYTHPDKNVMKMRFKKVTDVAVELLHQNIFVFSPISYNAPWEEYDLPHTFDFWEGFDKAFVMRMDSVIVLTLDGWKESKGVQEEIRFGEKIGLPIYHTTWEEVKDGTLAKTLKYNYYPERLVLEGEITEDALHKLQRTRKTGLLD